MARLPRKKALREMKKWIATLPRSTNLVIYCGCCPFDQLPEYPACLHRSPRHGLYPLARARPSDQLCGGLGREGLSHAEGAVMNCVHFEDCFKSFAKPGSSRSCHE